MAAHGIAGIASTGDHSLNILQHADHLTVLPPEALMPPEVVEAPSTLSNLPATTGLFIGRQAEMEALDAAVDGPGRTVVQALHGLGGIGKSTLVAHWAATRVSGHNPKWWITADSPAALETGIVGLAVALQPALANVLSREALLERGLQWLATHDDWLLILDNVTDPAHIQPLLARATAGRYIITSRRATGWHGTAATVRLDVLSDAEAVELFTRILPHDQPPNLHHMAQICTELGHLPLAIAQASAFCAETGTDSHTYLQMLIEHPAELYRAGPEGGSAARTIARIWHLTLDQFADDPLAGQILRILSWYGSDAIPRDLLTGLADPPNLAKAVGRLAAHSMITLNPVANTLSVHRLVQAVGRTPDSDSHHRDAKDITEAREQATTQLHSALPEDDQDPSNWPSWRSLLPHVEALISNTDEGSDSVTTCDLLIRAASFLTHQGAAARAATLLRRAAKGFRRTVGAKDMRTLTARNNLVFSYHEAGEYTRAIVMAERLLTDCEIHFGGDHPVALNCLNNLASAYRMKGQATQAIPLMRRALAGCEAFLGEDHPGTLAVCGNLANAYHDAGYIHRSLPLHKRTLNGRRRVFGDEHPSTHTARGNYANACLLAGNFDEAISLYERNLADRERILGEDHPDTLGSRSNLANAYQRAGDTTRAPPILKKNLSDCERLLGDSHPNTLVARGSLALAYRSVGDFVHCLPLYERTLADRRRVLGEVHPHTLVAQNNLALTYFEAGDFTHAVPLLKRCLADYGRIKNQDHPVMQSLRSALSDATSK